MSEVLYDLREELSRSFRFGEGHSLWRFVTEKFSFQDEIRSYIFEQTGIAIKGHLETCHRELPISFQILNENGLNSLSKIVSEISTEFAENYRNMVAEMARVHLGYDVVFESAPFLRFHFPTPAPPTYRGLDGKLLAYHSDTLFGDYFEQINCWMAFSACDGSHSVQIAEMTDSLTILKRFADSLEWDWNRFARARLLFFQKLRDDVAFRDFTLAACRPLRASYGEVHLFDARFVHGTGENIDDVTRVSLDFRIVKVSDYEIIQAKASKIGASLPGFDSKAYVKGAYFDSASAFEV